MPRRLMLAALLAAACLSHAAEPLPPAAAARAQSAGIPVEAVTFVVQRVQGGAPWAAAGADRPSQPASTLKLLTSLVALETLGPAYRGKSQLLAAGDVADGVLHGDLVLRGLGDVDLDAAAFERMLSALRVSGVREVRGDLILDRRFFDPPRHDVGAPPFDETPEFRYNVIPDALLLDTNLVRLDLAADDRSFKARIASPLDKVVVTTDMRLVDRACADWEDGWKLPVANLEDGGFIHIALTGDFPRNCTAATAINVVDRVAFAERLFRGLWQRMGGTFRGVARDGIAPAGSRVVAEHRSRAFVEILQDINKRSDNPVTRVAFLTLGALDAQAHEATTARRATAVVEAWMRRQGIDPAGLVLENGSGLSRVEKITPAQLAAVLRIAAAGPWAPEYLASLPIVAVDGGMRSRLRDSPAAAQARIKTGTLRDVTAVAGYVRDARGEMNVVAAMVNHPKAESKVARPILDALLDWVARSPGPEPAR